MALDNEHQLQMEREEHDHDKYAKRISIVNPVHTNTHTGSEELRTYAESNISEENSYAGSLGIGVTFTGVWTDCVNYSEVIVSIFSTKASATNGLKIEWSFDGIQVDGDDQFTISASSSKTFSFPCQAKYVRVKYTNNSTLESNLRIQTLLKRFASKGSSHRLKDNLNQEDDAIVTKSQIVGFTTGGGGGTDLINVKVNPSGALTVDATGSEVVIQETVPTDSTKVNPSLVLVYTGDLLTSVQKTIGGTTYTKLLTYTGDKITSVSSWS